MRDWDVELEVTHLLADRQALQERLERVEEMLRGYGGVAPYGDDCLRAQLRIPATSAGRAVEKAKNVFSLALIAARIPYAPDPTPLRAAPAVEASHAGR